MTGQKITTIQPLLKHMNAHLNVNAPSPMQQAVPLLQRRSILLFFSKALLLPIAALSAASLVASPAIAQARRQPLQPAKLPEALKIEKRGFVIAATNPSSLAYLPLMVAQQRGYFAQRGLEMEVVEYQSSARAMQAVGAGQADALCAWLENTLSPAGRALSLQSYALMGQAPMMALGAALRPSGQIQTLAQLRGRMLGVVALNSPTHTIALAALRSAGLRAGEVRFVSVGSPAGASAALRSGQIDALMHMDPLMLQLEQRGEIQILADLRSPEASLLNLGAALPSSCLSATTDFLQRYPGTAQASADAMLDALQWLSQASLRDILNTLPEAMASIDTQLFIASMARLRAAYSPNGQCAAPNLKALWQAMLEAEPTLRLDGIDPMRAHSNSLMLSSAARLLKS
jgi:NitT/TauT family transport system substrate-binding protein